MLLIFPPDALSSSPLSVLLPTLRRFWCLSSLLATHTPDAAASSADSGADSGALFSDACYGVDCGSHGSCIRPHQPQMFTVQSGPCTASGSCVGRPSGYSDSETCTIVPTGSFALSSCPIFVTEANFDHVLIDGTNYDGANCPSGVGVTPSSTISWASDGSVAGDGWEICAPAGVSCLTKPLHLFQG